MQQTVIKKHANIMPYENEQVIKSYPMYLISKQMTISLEVKDSVF